jgi:hypothetical protein
VVSPTEPPSVETRLDRDHRRLNNAAAVGFLIGSALFFAGVLLQSLQPTSLSAWTFFFGSVFFTAAGSAQLIDAVLPVDALGGHVRWGHASRIALAAAVVQWIGTVEFNINTWRGVLNADSAHLADSLIWRPDAVGSVMFLVASGIALAPAVRRARHRQVRNRSWYIAWFNMLGSMMSALAALGAWTLADGELFDRDWSTVGTAGGAVFFFVAAALLIQPATPVSTARA